MIWKKLSVNQTAVTIVILLSQMSTLSSAHVKQEDNKKDSPEIFPPARREPQGRDIDMEEAATDFILSPQKVNFTELSLNSLNDKNLTVTNVTLEQSASSNIYSNRSRDFVVKRPQGLVLTLSLSPSKDSSNESDEVTQSPRSENSSEEDIISTTLVNDLAEVLQNHTSKAYTILDRLKNLTNLKITKTAVGSGTNYGVKMKDKGKLKGFTRKETSSSKFKKSLKSKEVSTSSSEENDSSTSTSTTELVSTEVNDSPEHNTTLMSKAGGHIDHSGPPKLLLSPSETSNSNASPIHSPKPIVLKVANLTKLRQSIEVAQNNKNEIDHHNMKEEQEGHETRTIITADQVGGNRPTRMPFHFTTTTPAPPTTTEIRPSYNRYNKLHSPHNHIYAPTQDPVAISQHEDLNVEDFRDFRVANLVFGSKVGAQVSTYAPEPESAVNRPPSSKKSKSPPQEAPPTYSKGRLRTTKPPPTSPSNAPGNLPDSASSGVKNSHVRIVNNNNDNLPFYKEPGGVFKEHSNHKYNDNDDESNHISDRATVKYGPRSSSNSKQNSPQSPQPHYNHQQYQHSPAPLPPSPGPAYITATQQPLYHQPVQGQPVLHPGYNYPPPPSVNSHHVPQQQHVPYPQQPPGNYYPVQQQPVAYYPVQQQQPIYNNPAPNRGFVPVLQSPVYQQPIAQPIPAPPLQPVYANNPPTNQYNYNPPTQNIYKPPPKRFDPETDDYYGDPLPTPDKSKSSPSSSKPRRKKPVEDEEDDEEHEEEVEKPQRSPPPQPPRDYPKRQRNYNRDDDRRREKGRKDRDKPNDYDEEEPPPRRSNNNRRPSYDDYGNKDDRRDRNRGRDRVRDRGHGEDVGDYAQPNNDNHQPLFEDPAPGPNSDFVDLDNNFNNNDRNNNRQRNNRPFNPSPEDYGPIRPSLPDNSPNFDHPNIQYPNRGRNQNSRTDYDPRGFGVGYGPPVRQNLPLDPIYTQTIKQFDENKRPKQSENRGRPREPEPDQNDEEDDNNAPQDDDREERDERPPRRKEEEEEEEEEQPENRRKETEEEEEEPEEEEEETQNKETTPEDNPKSKRKQEEEEEEEEEPEDKSTKRRQERKNQEPKKPPPKKPKHEQSGNLDEDISGIEREFGGYFGAPGQGQPQNGGFSPPQNGGFSPPQNGGFSPPQNGGFNPPQNGGFSPPQSGGFTPPQNGGFNPPQNGGYNSLGKS